MVIWEEKWDDNTLAKLAKKNLKKKEIYKNEKRDKTVDGEEILEIDTE